MSSIASSSSKPGLRVRVGRTLAALCSLVLILAIGLVDFSRTAPGPLSAVHANVPELAGLDNCAACHGGWFGNMTSACTDCHEGVATDLEEGHGLHGTQPEGIRGERCGLCHGEHNGPGFQIAGPRSYAIAGVGARADVDHLRFGFDLAGAHLELECSECHAAADSELLAEGEARFRGLESDCASCHASEHAPVFPTDCRVCHDQSSFEDPSWPAHDENFQLVGAHAEASCRSCHAAESETSLEVHLGRRSALETTRTCSACHSSPHRAAFLDGLGGLLPVEGSGTDAACAACHSPEHGPFGNTGEGLTAEQHAASGFDLGAPHADVACADCHAGALLGTEPGAAEPLDFAARHPGRERESCEACHADPHLEQFREPGASSTSCRDCHGREAFEPTLFDAERHAALALPLDGAHASADCSSCHLPLGLSSSDEAAGPQLPGPSTGADADPQFATHAASATPGAAPSRAPARRFRGTDAACVACHEDVHAGFFADGPSAGACADCHTVETFRDASDAGVLLRDTFDHGRHCGFTLGGAHGQSDCAGCHPAADASGAERELGRFDGYLAGGARTAPAPHDLSADCALCHADPHAGNFAGLAPDTPRSFEPAGEEQDDSGPAGSADAEWHDQGANCASCHVPVSFRLAGEAFDHGSTGFELSGRHQQLGCSSCHTVQLDAQAGTQRVALTAGACADCHADPHAGQFEEPAPEPGSSAASDCTRCHEPARRFVEPHFNHNFDSRFRLEGAHASLDCSACHGLESAADGVSFVRYKPLDVGCSDCHGAQEDGALRRTARGK